MEIRNHIYNFFVDPKATGKRIKELRKAKGLTAEQLAEKLYRSTKAISSWETGARFPSIDNLVDLANFFDVSVHSLMLPNDNCEVEALETQPSKAGVNNHVVDKYSLAKIDDEALSKLFIREEYLIQRILSGVFTKGNVCEYETVILPFWRGNPRFEKTSQITNDSNTYFRFVKETKNLNINLHILFNRMYYGEQFPKSLSAMNQFDKDVLITALLYFDELREEKYLKYLYDIGARFIDCSFKRNAKSIEKGMQDNPSKCIFNISHVNINSDEELEEYLEITHESEDFKESIYELLEMPRYFENPSYYQGRAFRSVHYDEQKDLDARQKFLRYYHLIDYVRDSVKTYEDYEKRIRGIDGLSYDEYVKSLLYGGFISK